MILILMKQVVKQIMNQIVILQFHMKNKQVKKKLKLQFYNFITTNIAAITLKTIFCLIKCEVVKNVSGKS